MTGDPGPSGASGSTADPGPTGSHDPKGPTHDPRDPRWSGHCDPRHVGHDTLLGSWDNRFLYGMSGAGGPDPSYSQWSSADFHRSLASELNQVGGQCGEHWTSNTERTYGVSSKTDGPREGYAGRVDEDGRHHHDTLPWHHHC